MTPGLCCVVLAQQCPCQRITNPRGWMSRASQGFSFSGSNNLQTWSKLDDIWRFNEIYIFCPCPEINQSKSWMFLLAKSVRKKRIERVGGLVLQVRGAWRVATSTNPNSMNKAARREYQAGVGRKMLGKLLIVYKHLKHLLSFSMLLVI